MYKLQGIIPAMITPFKEDYSIDEQGLQRLVKRLAEVGCHSILIGGTTGEYTLMDDSERKKIFKLSVDAAQDTDTKILANTGCHGTEQTIKLTQYAKEVGADAALILPTYYLNTSKEGLTEHFKSIAENVDLPLAIYHYPQATGVLLEPEHIVELSKIDNLIGVKNTAPMQHTSRLLYLTKNDDEFDVITGYEHLILPTLACGGSGSIGIIHNITPKLLIEMYNLMTKEGNINKAREINEKLIPLYNLMEDEPCPAPVKEALKQMGLPSGPSREPIPPASDNMKKSLKNELDKLNLI